MTRSTLQAWKSLLGAQLNVKKSQTRENPTISNDGFAHAVELRDAARKDAHQDAESRNRGAKLGDSKVRRKRTTQATDRRDRPTQRPTPKNKTPQAQKENPTNQRHPWLGREQTKGYNPTSPCRKEGKEKQHITIRD